MCEKGRKRRKREGGTRTGDERRERLGDPEQGTGDREDEDRDKFPGGALILSVSSEP